MLALSIYLSTIYYHHLSSIFKCSFILRESEREREYMHARASGGSGRGREREKIPSRFHAVSTEPEVELDPMNREMVPWPEIKSWTPNRLTHPGTSKFAFLKYICLSSPVVFFFYFLLSTNYSFLLLWHHEVFKEANSFAISICTYQVRIHPAWLQTSFPFGHRGCFVSVPRAN